MARKAFDMHEPGKADDRAYYGGAGIYRDIDPKQGGYRIVDTEQDRITSRYQGMAKAAAARQAYQTDYTLADQDRENAALARTDQTRALEMMRSAATGNEPSQAAILGRGAVDQSLQAQMANQANVRGSSLAQSIAAQRGMAASQLGAVQQFGGMRSGELGQAQGAYGGGALAMRQQDYGQQSLMQERAAQQMRNELLQRQMNDKTQFAYEQMAHDVNKEAMNLGLAREQAYAQRYAANQKAESARDDATIGVIGAGMGAAGSMMGGAVASDERTKQDVLPLYEPEGQQLHVDGSGRAFLAREAAKKSGPSLSGPTPRYSKAPMSEAAAKSKATAKPERKMTEQEMAALADKMISETKAREQRELARGPAVKPREEMGAALEHMQPYAYQYRPGFREAEGQAPGESNVGPMAQDMATNPLTATAVKRTPDGMLVIDQPKALKLSLGGVGYLAAKQREQERRLAMLEGGEVQ